MGTLVKITKLMDIESINSFVINTPVCIDTINKNLKGIWIIEHQGS